MKSKLLLLLPLLAATTACKSEIKRIDASGDEAVVSTGVDYGEIIEFTDSLTQQMLSDGFFDSGEFGKLPITMVVSKIENKTDLAHFPTELLLSNIRSALLQSGKARFTTAYGEDGTDEMTRDTQDLKNDPLFDSKQVPAQGQAAVARLSVRTQILWVNSQGVDTSQNTYLVRMVVTDVVSGLGIWERRSNPVAKKFDKDAVSW
ncbi:MAG: hypothetical protein ACI8X5_000789 [Planctomycetota bacterium]|jgi:hypothetical protein